MVEGMEYHSHSQADELDRCFKSAEKGVEVGDIAMFQRQETDLAFRWVIGVMIDLDKGKDGKVRRVTIKYQNAGEDSAICALTTHGGYMVGAAYFSATVLGSYFDIKDWLRVDHGDMFD